MKHSERHFFRMKTWVRKTLSVGVLAAGALLFAPGAANADVRQSTGDNNGILNGTQIAVPVSVPVNIVGNGLGILGVANASGVGFNQTESARRDRQSTGNNNGILNGTQAYLPINVPVNVVGNAVAVLGGAQATGVGVNGRRAESAHTTEGGWGGWGGQSTGDNNGIANGTQIYAPIDVPINVCGNSIALLGGASSQALCANNVWAPRVKRHHAKKESAKITEGARQSTGDNNGILNGTQLLAPINLPVNLAGNSVALLGSADSRAVAVNESGHPDGFSQSTGDNNGILNGTQVGIPINVPINVCGNSLGILGAAHSAAGCVNGSTAPAFGGGDNGWGDDNGNGHGHGHKPGNGDNAGDNGDDNGNDDGDYAGDNGEQPAATDDGYNGEEPASDGYTKPATTDEEPAAGYDGRDKSTNESSPVTGLTNTVSGDSGLGGLGLLNTLR
jgi:hypothetical protein